LKDGMRQMQPVLKNDILRCQKATQKRVPHSDGLDEAQAAPSEDGSAPPRGWVNAFNYAKVNGAERESVWFGVYMRRRADHNTQRRGFPTHPIP